MSCAFVPRLPLPLYTPHPAPYTLWQWQDVSYPIASCADILNINTTSLSLSLSLASNFQLTASCPSSPPVRQCVQSGSDLSATLPHSRWNNASHLTVDTLTPARDAHKIIQAGEIKCLALGDARTTLRHRMRMNLGLDLPLPLSLPSLFFWVLYCTLIRKWQQPQQRQQRQQRQRLVISSVSCGSPYRAIATVTTTITTTGEQDSCK